MVATMECDLVGEMVVMKVDEMVDLKESLKVVGKVVWLVAVKDVLLVVVWVVGKVVMKVVVKDGMLVEN